jgi:hypothetical protein
VSWAALVLGAVLVAAPDELALPGFRLHVQVHEDVDADRLAGLARPGVVLWLLTSSNLLRRSTAERLGRCDAAYVQVRPPWTSGVRAQFTGRVHPWVSEEELDVAAYRRWAPAGTEIELTGALTEERMGRVLALHPLGVRWRPDGVPTPEEWARAAKLPGVELHPAVLLPPCERRLKRAERIRLRLPAGDAEASAAGCGFALRLEVSPTLGPPDVQALLVAHPGAELWVEVKSDADAAGVQALARLLAASVPPAPAKSAAPGKR